MSQTVNGQNTEKATEKTPKSAQRNYRPGQRQQDRLQRAARRQKRRRIIGAILAAIVVIALVIASDVWFQNYTAAQAVIAGHAQATSTTRAKATAAVNNAHASATASVYAQATAAVLTKNCFITPDGPAVPPIYTSSATPTSGPSTSPAASGTPVTLADGLKYIDMKVGTGAVAKTGSNVTANYTGWLANGCQIFDSSYNSHSNSQTGQTQPAQPATFQLAQGQVIAGWVEGVTGMKVGGIRRIYIPAALGYGAQGSSPVIPPNADLVFDVQLVAVA